MEAEQLVGKLLQESEQVLMAGEAAVSEVGVGVAGVRARAAPC